MARTAQVKRDARIGEAEAKRDSGIKVRKYNQFIYLLEDLNVNNLELYLFQEALADEARMRAKFENDTEIAKAKRDYELKKAAYDIEVFTKVFQRSEIFVTLVCVYNSMDSIMFYTSESSWKTDITRVYNIFCFVLCIVMAIMTFKHIF